MKRGLFSILRSDLWKNLKFRDDSVVLKHKNTWVSCTVSYYELSAFARRWINRDQMYLGVLLSLIIRDYPKKYITELCFFFFETGPRDRLISLTLIEWG